MSSARTIALLLGHPDPGPSLCRSLADRYGAAATEAGHTVHYIDGAAITFPMIRTASEYEHGDVPPEIATVQEAIRASDRFVLVFPMWIGSLPAYTKGLVEQIFRPGFALDTSNERGFPKKLMTGKSARIIMTMGMPAFAYRLFFRAHGLKNLENNLLRFCGFKPVDATLLGRVASASQDTIEGWLDDLAALGREAA